MPAPIGNTNATRKHGLRASRIGDKYTENQVQAMRSHFLEALREIREPTAYDSALLQSAARHEGRALLAAAWLRKEGKTLTVNERLALTATISNATDSRDKCLKLLGLDRLAEHADDPLHSIPVFESKASHDGGLATQTPVKVAPASAATGECDSSSGPIEATEQSRQVPSSQVAGDAATGNCDSGQDAFTREDRNH